MDIAKLVTAYYALHPDPGEVAQRVSFGTSGHRGSALTVTFNEDHIVAATQAICDYRAAQGIDGPLYLGADTHALSEPAQVSALEVLAANHVRVLLDARGGYTPTPAVSRAILAHNMSGTGPRADGIVVTPSHNPPPDGGFKYNPPDGGPAGTDITRQIQDRANALLADGLAGVRRMPYARAAAADTTGRFDFLDAYVSALPQVVDVAAIRAAGVRIAADPLGGASVCYWGEIAERYGLDLTVVNPVVDATFRFMTLDWDGKIRMDCSSPPAMAGLIGRQHEFAVATGNDTDADRHGIVTPDGGLLNPNHYLAVAIDYLYRRRAGWPLIGRGRQDPGQLVDDRPGDRRPGPPAAGGAGRVQVVRARSAGRLGRLRRRGERRGLVPAARRVGLDDRQGRDHPRPARLGDHRGDRAIALAAVPRPYRPLWRARLRPYRHRGHPGAEGGAGRLSAEQVTASQLAGEKITEVLTTAPGNGAPIGGVKVVAESGWFAARPSGTEDVYKLYAESFRGPAHLAEIQDEARGIVAAALDSGKG